MALVYSAGKFLDATRLRETRDEFDLLAQANEDVTIDLSKVEYIDTSGVGALVFVLKRVRAAGRHFQLINATGQPQSILHETGLVRARDRNRNRNHSRSTIQLVR